MILNRLHVSNTASKGFFLVKYFCGSQLASCRRGWSSLRDNATSSTLSPTIFYSPLLTTIRDLEVPETFCNTAKDFYALLLRKICTSPILHRFWAPFVPHSFSLTVHWQRVRDNFTENFKNDLAWLISLRAVKVRDSLRNWGYIDSSRCASCPRVETIDHCFLNCRRVRPVWLFFLPLLTSLLGSPFTRIALLSSCINFLPLRERTLDSYFLLNRFFTEFGDLETRPLFTTVKKIRVLLSIISDKTSKK